MSNAITWNCCTGGKEPDWSIYDALELAGCIEYDKDTDHSFVERVDGEDPEFYCLYAHLQGGGCEAIHDFDSTAKLEMIRENCQQLADKIKFPFYDYS